jgi:hypothetical protein
MPDLLNNITQVMLVTNTPTSLALCGQENTVAYLPLSARSTIDNHSDFTLLTKITDQALKQYLPRPPLGQFFTRDMAVMEVCPAV